MEAKIIQYFDFEDLDHVANPDGSNSLIEIPKLTQPNLLRLINEHNLLVYEFLKFKSRVEENLNEIKQNNE